MATTRRPSPVVPVLAFAAVCAACTFGVLTALHRPFTWHYAAVIIYFAGITLVLHHWQEGALVTDPKGFVNRFMLGLVLKMLVSLVVIVVLLFLLPRAIAVPLALTFAVLYLAFLAFSTIRLMGRSRKPS